VNTIQRGLPPSSNLLGASRWTPAFRSVRGTNGHIISHDIASWRNRDYCRLKQATEDLLKPCSDGSLSAVGRGDRHRSPVNIGFGALLRTQCRCLFELMASQASPASSNNSMRKEISYVARRCRLTVIAKETSGPGIMTQAKIGYLSSKIPTPARFTSLSI
jgi:hypothetical protein